MKLIKNALSGVFELPATEAREKECGVKVGEVRELAKFCLNGHSITVLPHR